MILVHVILHLYFWKLDTPEVYTSSLKGIHYARAPQTGRNS